MFGHRGGGVSSPKKQSCHVVSVLGWQPLLGSAESFHKVLACGTDSLQPQPLEH